MQYSFETNSFLHHSGPAAFTWTQAPHWAPAFNTHLFRCGTTEGEFAIWISWFKLLATNGQISLEELKAAVRSLGIFTLAEDREALVRLLPDPGAHEFRKILAARVRALAPSVRDYSRSLYGTARNKLARYFNGIAVPSDQRLASLTNAQIEVALGILADEELNFIEAAYALSSHARSITYGDFRSSIDNRIVINEETLTLEPTGMRTPVRGTSYAKASTYLLSMLLLAQNVTDPYNRLINPYNRLTNRSQAELNVLRTSYLIRRMLGLHDLSSEEYESVLSIYVENLELFCETY